MRHPPHEELRHRLFGCGHLLALWLCLAPVGEGLAVEKAVLPDVVVRNWELDDGLPSARINAIVRAPDGYLWLGTQLGVVRFDGVRFAIYDTSNTPGMRDDRVSCLLVDSRGDLWAATSGGTLLKREGQIFRVQDLGAVAGGQLGLFERGRWRKLNSPPPESQTVRTISRARDGGLWVATGTVDPIASRDLHIYKLKEEKWSPELQPYPWPEDSQQFQRLAFLEDRVGSIWCATAGGVFCRTPAGSWQRVLSVAPWIQVEVMCLAEDENELLWMGTRTTGLLQVQKRQVMTLSLPASASQHAVLTACAASDGSVWCGTDGAGIFRWQGDRVTQFGTEHGVTSLHVAALLEDRHTNLWVGSVNGLFRRVGERFEPAGGLPALREPILALLEDRQGNLWTGGRAGLVRLNAQGGRWYGEKEGLCGGAVRALAEDREGRIWVGAADVGIYRLEDERGKRHFRLFQTRAGSIPKRDHPAAAAQAFDARRRLGPQGLLGRRPTGCRQVG
jgi:ligand-binding sensor domain-containing protein